MKVQVPAFVQRPWENLSLQVKPWWQAERPWTLWDQLLQNILCPLRCPSPTTQDCTLQDLGAVSWKCKHSGSPSSPSQAPHPERVRAVGGHLALTASSSWRHKSSFPAHRSTNWQTQWPEPSPQHPLAFTQSPACVSSKLSWICTESSCLLQWLFFFYLFVLPSVLISILWSSINHQSS